MHWHPFFRRTEDLRGAFHLPLYLSGRGPRKRGHRHSAMKPAARGIGLGVDHLETVGGRHRYVKHMTTHLDRLAKVGPQIDFAPPKAAFGNGKYRTPQAADKAAGKTEKLKSEEFKEVAEAFRRVLLVHGGGRKTATDNHVPDWQVQLAANISRNRRLGSKTATQDAAHAAELYHQRRRIANSYSMTEQKKNKLNPDVYPVYQMRKARFNSAAELLVAEMRRAASSASPSPRARPQSAPRERGSQSARIEPKAYASAAMAMAGGGRPAVADSSAGGRTQPARARPHSARAATHSARVPTSGAGARRPVAAPAAPAPAAAAAASAEAAPGSAPAAAAAQSSYGDVSLGKPTSDVGVLRRRLLEKIVDKRLFRESELRPFLVAVGLGNKHLDAAMLKEAIRAVETEFYL